MSDKELFDISVLEKYIPTPLTQDEIKQILLKILEDSQLTLHNLDGKSIGKVMKDFNAIVKGRATGSDASKVLKQMQQV